MFPFWVLLLFRADFLLTTLGLGLGLVALTLIYLYILPGQLLLMVGVMAALIVWYVFRWASTFFISMTVDYDAANGDGLVIIQRYIPHPTEPETVQFPLQQAAEGSPEVNTKGLFNTLVLQIKWLSFLRPFTVGDLTLRGPAAPFGLKMPGIQDPGGVKARIQADWKKIAAIKNKKKAEADRKEDIERMAFAVAQGITAAAHAGLVELKTPATSIEFKPDTLLAKAQNEVKQQLVPPPEPPPPSPPPPTGVEPLKDPGVSDLRGTSDGNPPKPNGHSDDDHVDFENLPPTESTGTGEAPEPPPDDAVGSLGRR